MDFHLKWHFVLPGSLLHSSEMKENWISNRQRFLSQSTKCSICFKKYKT